MSDVSNQVDNPAPAAAADDSTGDQPVLESIVEALLFSTEAPLPASKMASLVGNVTAKDITRAVETLNRRYEESEASFRIQGIAKGFQMLTLPEFNPWLMKLHKARTESRLSSAALETLAIVAYKQPIMRADIEAIRGVSAGEMLARLRDMNLVRIAGRAEVIGRPLLYGTTRRFLELFGLQSVDDLPKLEPSSSSSPQAIPKLHLPDDSDVDAGNVQETDEGEVGEGNFEDQGP